MMVYWIRKYVMGGSLGIKINDDNGHDFQTKKRLIQGDYISPILFSSVANMISYIDSEGKESWPNQGSHTSPCG